MTTIDVDKWIEGAKRPQRSVKVYRRADLVAQVDALNREIEIATAAGEDVTNLEDRWEKLASEFRDSALTITMRALTADEVKAITARGKLEKRSDDDIGAELLAASIVDPPMTVAQLYALRRAIGDPQADRLTAAYLIASRMEPPALEPKSRAGDGNG